MQQLINKLVEGDDLSREEAKDAMHTIMSGNATGAQIGAFLTALRLKGETIEEVSACAKVMREFADTIHPKVDGILVDTCGTGGDKVKTFNISTIAAFVVAGADIAIAKHGNRSVTSKAGSADVMEALGIKIDLPPKDVEKCIEDVGIGFMFAPVFHKAMEYAIGPRKEIGIRTIFNILGPLTNPANAGAQVLGVFDSQLTEKMAKVLGNLGVDRALVVHGMEGLDEISTLGKTQVSELEDGKVDTYEIGPADFGLEKASITDIAGGDAEANAKIAVDLLKMGKKGARRDIVILNAAAGIYIGGKAASIKEGIEIAEAAVDSGKAAKKLESLVEYSNAR